MSNVNRKLAKSLSADSVELIPYLPFFLQDLWELGSSPADMIHLVSKHMNLSKEMKILDLACGKGAVSIQMAKKFGCSVKGIDLIQEFILDAKDKALENNVEDLCDFSIEDINLSVNLERGFDLVVLGAVGDVLGMPQETLIKLSATIKQGGYILIDDAYAKAGSNSSYMNKEDWLKAIEDTNLELVEDLIVDSEMFSDLLDDQMANISKRAFELKIKYPEKAQIFDAYLESQLSECEILENDVTGVTMLLRKK